MRRVIARLFVCACVLSGLTVQALPQSSPAKPPTPKPYPSPPVAAPTSSPAATQAPTQTPSTPAATPTATPSAVPTSESLGLPTGGIYPAAQFLASYDAGRGQRYYLFGASASFAEVVNYYKTVLKQKGELVFEEPQTHMFDIGRFREEAMAFPPSVTVKGLHVGGHAGIPESQSRKPAGPVPDRHSDRSDSLGDSQNPDADDCMLV